MSNRFCCVFGCTSLQRRDKGVSFHTFPQKGLRNVLMEMKSGQKESIDRHTAWIMKLKMGKPVTKNMRVCSRHFKDSDFFFQKNKGSGRFLKRDAIPSMKLPTVIHGTPGKPQGINNSRKQRAEHRAFLKESLANETVGVCEQETTEHTEQDLEAANVLLALLNQEEENRENPKQFRDFQVQVNVPGAVNVCSLITSDRALNSMTGLSSFSMLDVIIKAVTMFYRDERVHKLTLRHRIILTLVKLKCNLSYYVLAILFNISNQLCANYVNMMLPILSAALKPAIHFVDIAEVKNNVPKCFDIFPNVRFVVDCTEVIITKPKCLCCRIRFYSQYKSNTTVKIMTAVSPGGLITFISKVYGGRASDKIIFEQSDLITKPTRGEAVMVDKGFLIDDLCDSFGIELIRPPFLRNKRQLSAEEAAINAQIAKARVHVERVNQRLKLFKILNGPIVFNFVHHMDNVFTIICGITNLSAPILSDDRF